MPRIIPTGTTSYWHCNVSAYYVRLSADTVQVLQGVTDGMRMLNAKPKMLSTLDDGNE